MDDYSEQGFSPPASGVALMKKVKRDGLERAIVCFKPLLRHTAGVRPGAVKRSLIASVEETEPQAQE